MTSPAHHILKFLFPALVIVATQTPRTYGDEPAKKIKGLFIPQSTAKHSDWRTTAITEGISKRSKLPIEWVIGENTEAFFSRDDWAKDTDIVVYSGQIKPQVIGKVLEFHRSGSPALLIHDSLIQSEDEEWTAFCGAEVSLPKAKRTKNLSLSNTEKNISLWLTPRELVINVKNPVTTSKILYQIEQRQSVTTPAVWSHEYGPEQSRIFAVTPGSNNKTLNQPPYLDILTNGFLWATRKSPEEHYVSASLSSENHSSTLTTGHNLFTRQSSRSSSENSDYAIDGDIETYWETEKGDIINWWRGSLDEPREIAALAIVWQNETDHPYLIEGSSDLKSWKLIAESSSLPNQVSYHRVDGIHQHIRISNPATGILNGIVEFGAYQHLNQVPFHLVPNSGEKPLPEISTPPAELNPNPAQTALTPEDLFVILDDQNNKTEWDQAFKQLATFHSENVVSDLISRTESTRSGAFRTGAVTALGALYRDSNGDLWEGSGTIQNYLNHQFENKRFSQKQLLTVHILNEIPLENFADVFENQQENPELKLLKLRVLEKNRLSYRSIKFLTGIIRDDSEPFENRTRAGTLLAQSPDMLAMRDAFHLSSETGINEESDLFQAILANPTWEAQIEWLLSKLESEIPNEPELARKLLTMIQSDPATRAENRELVNASVEDIFLIEETATAPREAPIGSMSSDEISKALATNEAADLENGESIFNRNCSSCHAKKVPILFDLTRDDLVEAILKPDANVSPDYQTFEFRLNDGKNHTGFISRESKNELEIVDQAGNAMVLDRLNIKDRKPVKRSAMQPNLTHHLSAGDFNDLISYLEQL
ncbi:MAG: discoidin domain-containing protein [Verrucomicrobiales bacterium]|nr:discoidin domain-containing protein [Verrucomicrobiales bacterium]